MTESLRLTPESRIHPDHAIQACEAAAYVLGLAAVACHPLSTDATEIESAASYINDVAHAKLTHRGLPTDERNLTYGQMKAHALAYLEAASHYIKTKM
jgi:hypothetical protein